MKTHLNILTIAACLGTGIGLVLTSGCAGDSYHRSTGEAIDDHTISSRVKTALKEDSEYKFPLVEVKTFKDTVQLSGFVKSSQQKSRAADIAKQAAGSRNVENNITVRE